MRAGGGIRPNPDYLLGAVQQKLQNDKRRMRCYRYDPHGHVFEYVTCVGLTLPCLALLIEFVRDPDSRHTFPMGDSGIKPLRWIYWGAIVLAVLQVHAQWASSTSARGVVLVKW